MNLPQSSFYVRPHDQVLYLIPQPAVLLDIEGRIADFNAGFRGAFDRVELPIHGVPIGDFLDLVDDAACTTYLRGAKRGDVDVSREGIDVCFGLAGGSVDLHIGPILSPSGDVTAHLALCPIEQDRSLADWGKLRAKEMRWRIALESADQAVWDSYNTTQENYVSDTWFTMRGITRATAAERAPQEWLEAVHPDDRDAINESFEQHNTGVSDAVNHLYRHRHADGRWIWVLSRGRIVSRDRSGLPLRLIGTDTDVTDLKSIEVALAASADRLDLSLEVAGIGLWQYGEGRAEGDVRTHAIFGLDPGAKTDDPRTWIDRLHPEDQREIVKTLVQCMETGSDFLWDMRLACPGGLIRHIRCKAKYVDYGDGHGGRLIGVVTDISEDVHKTEQLETARAALEFESQHDALTGLANRRKLNEAQDQLMSGGAEGGVAGFAVMHLDLDHFKQINDQYGHQAGDAVLVRSAKILREALSEGGLAARVGGDEFTLLILQNRSEAWLRSLAERIIAAVNAPFAYQGTYLRYGISIGIARSDPQLGNLARTFANADAALYAAKDRGRGGFAVFTEPGSRAL